MANKVLVLQDGKAVTVEGSANGQVLTWSQDNDQATFEAGGGGGSGTVTSVGLTGGTSGIVIGGTASPITTSGTFNLDAPLRFAFNTTSPTAVEAAGQVAYNTDEGSLEQMFDGGHVKSVLGQTLHQRVLNDTGSTLAKGQVVYVSGAQGNRVTVSLAQANADSTSATIIGLVAYAITDEAEGYVITEGLIKGVNTNGFTEGLPVYLSPTTPGALTQTKPEAPQHLVLVGYCARADATVGEILVKTQNGYELGELHDVYINNPTSGQILIYDATTGQTRWENASLTGGTGVTVTPGAGSLSVAIGQAVGTSDSPTFASLSLTTALSVANGGTGATTTQANKVFAGPTTGADAAPSFRALVAADVAGLTPYDLSGEFVGTPASSAVLMRFVAARAFTFGGTAYFACATGPTSTATFTVNVNGVSKGTVTISTSATSGTGTITSTNIAAGDSVTVVATTPAAIVSPYWTLPGTV